jgi:hypothetical protein
MQYCALQDIPGWRYVTSSFDPLSLNRIGFLFQNGRLSSVCHSNSLTPIVQSPLTRLYRVNADGGLGTATSLSAVVDCYDRLSLIGESMRIG